MLTAALAAVGSHPQPNPHATAADRLRWLIEHAVETVDNGIGLGGLAAMLTDADKEIVAIYKRHKVKVEAYVGTLEWAKLHQAFAKRGK